MFSQNIQQIHRNHCRIHNERNDVLLPDDNRRPTNIVSNDHVDDPEVKSTDNNEELVSFDTQK